MITAIVNRYKKYKKQKAINDLLRPISWLRFYHKGESLNLSIQLRNGVCFVLDSYLHLKFMSMVNTQDTYSFREIVIYNTGAAKNLCTGSVVYKAVENLQMHFDMINDKYRECRSFNKRDKKFTQDCLLWAVKKIGKDIYKKYTKIEKLKLNFKLMNEKNDENENEMM